MQRRDFKKNGAIALGTLPLLSKISFAASAKKSLRIVNGGKALATIAIPVGANDIEQQRSKEIPKCNINQKYFSCSVQWRLRA